VERLQQYEQDVVYLRSSLDKERLAYRQLQRQFDLLQAQAMGSVDVSRYATCFIFMMFSIV
jgi:hypothetical protein